MLERIRMVDENVSGVKLSELYTCIDIFDDKHLTFDMNGFKIDFDGTCCCQNRLLKSK